MITTPQTPTGDPVPSLERMREILDLVPARRTAGIRGVDLGTGHAEVAMDIPAWAHDEAGDVVPGLLAVLADTALGVSVTSGISPDAAMVTTHLHLGMPQRVPRAARTITCTARFLSRDGSYGVGEGLATADTGEVVARIGLGALLLDTTPVATNTPTDASVMTPPPGGRPVEGPVHAELATEITASAPGSVTATVVARPRFANSRGLVHGGFGALFGERVLDLALAHAAGGPHGMRPVDLHVTYLRSVAADDRSLCCRGSVLHAGRRFAATRGEVRRHDGRLAILVEGSYVAAGAPAAGAES